MEPKGKHGDLLAARLRASEPGRYAAPTSLAPHRPLAPRSTAQHRGRFRGRRGIWISPPQTSSIRNVTGAPPRHRSDNYLCTVNASSLPRRGPKQPFHLEQSSPVRYNNVKCSSSELDALRARQFCSHLIQQRKSQEKPIVDTRLCRMKTELSKPLNDSIFIHFSSCS